MDNRTLGRHRLANMPNTPHIPPNAVRLIEVLAFEHVQLLDVSGPLQVFACANERVAEASGMFDTAPPYDLRVVSRDGRPVTASAGLGLMAHPLPTGEVGPDTLIIAGGPGVKAAASDPVLVDWVRVRAGQARRVTSVCTGAFLLAASGMLDGRRATTHWSFCSELARRHPAIDVQHDPIFVQDGPVWTSAGVTAGIDLALALVEADLGRRIALAVARHLVVFLKRPGGQAQFSTALALQTADDGFDGLHEWMAEHLADDLTLPTLASQAAMSERSFSRRYLDATGVTPARAVERLRVEAARHMLSETGAPVKRVAQRCGFGSEETMRRSFLRILAATPQDYRARFS